FTNASGHARRLRLQWSVKTDLRPGWFSESLGIRDGQDAVAWRPDRRIFVARDLQNPWFCVWGSLPSADALPIDQPRAIESSGQGVTAASSHRVTVGAHTTSTLTFVVSGSSTTEADAVAGYERLPRQPAPLPPRK